MRRKFEQLKQNLTWFVEQRDNLVLVVDTTEHEIPYVLKMLDAVEQEHASDVFLAFAHDIIDADDYLSILMDNVQTQLAAVNELRRKAQQPNWPLLPPECTSRRVAPSERLKALLLYVRAQLPEGDHRIVLGLLPTTLGNAAEYARVITGLLPKNGLEPWMVGVRILVRDNRERPFLIPYVEKERIARVALYERLDLSPEALAQALAEDAVSPEVPEAERAMALVQLAASDHAHRRYDQAFEKWGVLFNYYYRQGNIPMQAMCLCSRAEALRYAGRPKEAKLQYQQGLALAQDLSTLPIAMTLLMGIGEVCLQLEQWVEAEGFLSLADQVAAKTFQVYSRCDIMVRHGVALLACGRTAEARARWRVAADLCRELEYYERQESALANLVELFDRAGMRREASEHRQELAQVRHQRHAAGAHRGRDQRVST